MKQKITSKGGRKRTVSRRNFVKWGGAAVCCGAGGLLYCATEPYWLKRTLRTVLFKKSNLKTVRIMHVSDLHIGNRQQLEFAARSLRAELAQSPDLICMTGDFINRKLFNPRECSQLFAALAAKAPVVACLGNHDGGRWVRRRGGYPDALPVTELLSKSGVTVLRNENRVVEIRGQPLTLVGLDDKWSGSLDAERGFQGLLAAPPGPRIVLAHNPDMKGVLKNYAWDLMLSGHTHGGQVCLPFLGAPVLPVEDRRFTHGLYPWDGRQIHVSSGVGTSCGVRFNCPPEICHLELKGSVS